ncbi:Nischarin (Imidazoline receptor 1) (I-1) (IR1) (Imidazoline receptor I-1-like protein) (Imidazoline-1 receptor) (I1R) [Durusdinium trenchii]|uniref:Nischarin (Imidazoline receptor 1) (I-1) (IR1) (Imidazoline receptor I-1-like protein) (Imidazoline-1 receptor) (I1R) n=1 Tax=Durusdinium trenchii TaxID=1381693 RepID=A0ABP0IWU1_9DINO
MVSEQSGFAGLLLRGLGVASREAAIRGALGKLVRDGGTRLSLRRMDVTDAHVDALIAALEEFAVLAHLDLSENRVSAAGAERLMRFVWAQAERARTAWRPGRDGFVCLCSVDLTGNAVPEELIEELAVRGRAGRLTNVLLSASWVFVRALGAEDASRSSLSIAAEIGWFSVLRASLEEFLCRKVSGTDLVGVLLHCGVVAPDQIPPKRRRSRSRTASFGSSTLSTSASQAAAEEDFEVSVSLRVFLTLAMALSSEGVAPSSVEVAEWEARLVSDFGLETFESSLAAESMIVTDEEVDEEVSVSGSDQGLDEGDESARSSSEDEDSCASSSSSSGVSSDASSPSSSSSSSHTGAENSSSSEYSSTASEQEGPSPIVALDLSGKELRSLEAALEDAVDETLETLNARNNSLGAEPQLACFPAHRMFARLHTLDLSHNALVEVDRMLEAKALPALKFLDVSHNMLRTVRGLDALDGLVELKANSNRLRDVSYLVGLRCLKTLDLSQNLVPNITALRGLALNSNMEQLWLVDNPVSRGPRYRAQVIHLLPFLERLDDKALPPSSAKKNRTRQPQKNHTERKRHTPPDMARLAELSKPAGVKSSSKAKATFESKGSSNKDDKAIKTNISNNSSTVTAALGKKQVDAMCARLAKPRNSASSSAGGASRPAVFGSSVPRQVSAAPIASAADQEEAKERTLPKRLLAPTDAFRRKTVDGAKAAEEEARKEISRKRLEVKRARRRSRNRGKKVSAVEEGTPGPAPNSIVRGSSPPNMPPLDSPPPPPPPPPAAKPASPQISSSPPPPPPPLASAQVSVTTAEDFVLEQRFKEWQSDAEQQLSTAKTALSVLNRVAFSEDQLTDYQERLMEVGLWQRIDSPPVQTDADVNASALALQRKVEMSKAAVRNIVQLLQEQGKDSESVRSYCEYLVQTGLVSASEQQDQEEDEEDAISAGNSQSVLPSASLGAASVTSTSSSRSSVRWAPIPLSVQPVQQAQTQQGQVQQQQQQQSGVSLTEELLRQREGPNDNESVASSVWSVEGQASIRPPDLDNSLGSSNLASASASTSTAPPALAAASTPASAAPLVDVPPSLTEEEEQEDDEQQVEEQVGDQRHALEATIAPVTPPAASNGQGAGGGDNNDDNSNSEEANDDNDEELSLSNFSDLSDLDDDDLSLPGT